MNVIDTLQGSSASVSSKPATKNDAASEDRFLKLLVAQMKNQDPLNPLDNAQVTSQMAQISTVNGIEKLNTTVAGLNSQMVQLQAMQGASLVGHDVSVPGDRLHIASGVGDGAFELAGTAERVKVELLNPGGRVVDTLELGTLGAGTHDFNWAAANTGDGSGYRFRVSATQGSSAVAVTPLMRDRVEAVSAGGTALQLDLQYSGSVAYDKVRAVH